MEGDFQETDFRLQVDRLRKVQHKVIEQSRRALTATEALYDDVQNKEKIATGT